MIEVFEKDRIEYEIEYWIKEGYPGDWFQPPDDPEVIIKTIRKYEGCIGKEEFKQVRDSFMEQIDLSEAIEEQNDRDPFFDL